MIELPSTLFDAALPGLARPLTRPEGQQATKYLETLIKWQKTQRLVGSTNASWLIENVVLDSLCFLAAIPSSARAVADLGSGAGIPGVILAIVRPEIRFQLIEARQRRASFLSAAVREAALSNVTVTGARVEALVDDGTATFDTIVMRCAGSLTELARAAMPLLKAGGVLIASGKPNEKAKPGDVSVRDLAGRQRLFHVLTKPSE